MKILPIQGCLINEYFEDAKDPQFERVKYCFENCWLKCLRGMEYKMNGPGSVDDPAKSWSVSSRI